MPQKTDLHAVSVAMQRGKDLWKNLHGALLICLLLPTEYRYHFTLSKFFSNTYHPRTSRHFFFFLLFLLFYITSKNDATFWCSINEGQEGHLANFHSPLCTNLKRHVFLLGVCNTLNLHVFTFCNHHSLVLFFILLCWKTLRKKQ